MWKLVIVLCIAMIGACAGIHKQIQDKFVLSSSEYVPEHRWYFGKTYMWKLGTPHKYSGVILTATDSKERWNFSFELMKTKKYVVKTEGEKDVKIPALEPLNTGISTSSQTSRVDWYGDIAMRYRVWQMIITPAVREPFKLKMADRLGLGLGTNTCFQEAKYTLYLKEEENGKATGKVSKRNVTNPLEYSKSDTVIFLTNSFDFNVGLLKGQFDLQVPLDISLIKDESKVIMSLGVEF
jgi:hypothetical protein